MSEKFKAIVINNQNENFSREIKDISSSELKDGNVLVKVDYSSLNYKDAMILKDGGRIVRKFPFVPGIDFSGTVVESEDDKFKKNDNVILTGFRVGEAYFGGFSQYARVDSNFLIKTPQELDSHKAMMLGTAGFTALLCAFAVKAKEELLLGEKVKDVLVTGATGGVGSIAVMILTKMGYDVHAVTGKKDKNEYLKNLGAKNIIDRKEFEGESKLLEKGIWDGVVDTVGGLALTKIFAQTKPGGIVAACGNAGGIKINTTVMPFIIRGIKLWGIDSSGSSIARREFIWNEAAKLVDFTKLESLTKELSFNELLETYPKLLKGEYFGRAIVNPNK
ncbi:oxidoreductase [Pelagibacteraceae bacterium]|jgi:acrylyl-CoA reductase (NADPH)|nr:oxidoreductase [Pelagibacteraceae bacterium]MDC3232891.1 oxidoreductase [Pelagibacteraceae bacterium]|tara:strand:- start:539 stop:1540 length:1002 start_codon:yes stop_codon:yes gene_type:complete